MTLTLSAHGVIDTRIAPYVDTDHYTIVDVEPDTPEWGHERLGSIGASEIAAALGESIFEDSTPLSTWMLKRGLMESDFDPVHSYTSHAAEPLIAGWVERFHPEVGTILPGFMARSKRFPWLHATFDRVVLRPDGTFVPLQLKTSSPFARDKWRDGIPADYLAQEDAESLILNDAPGAFLAVWHYGPTDFELHWLPARQDRQLDMIERTRTFWHDNVLAGIPPSPQLGDDMVAIYPGYRGKPKFASEDALDAVGRLTIAKSDKAALNAPIDAEIAECRFVIEKFLGNATELVHPVTKKTVHHWRPRKDGARVHYTPKPKESVE